jgi:hypothetical protein
MKRRAFIKTVAISCAGCCCHQLAGLAHTASAVSGAQSSAVPISKQIDNAGIYRGTPFSVDGKTYSPAALLKKYDDQKLWRRQLYLPVFGENMIDGILDEMRASYAAVIPHIPFIGRHNYHLQWVIPNAEKLADYLVAKDYGVTIAQFSSLHLAQAARDLYDKYSEQQRRQIGKSQFGIIAELMMRMVAFRSQLRFYPDDYILKFVKGTGDDFDWGLDYTQCTNIFLYERHGARDLVYPLICAMDYVAGAALYTGYHRTKTLVLGDPLCDMRWKWQG